MGLVRIKVMMDKLISAMLDLASNTHADEDREGSNCDEQGDMCVKINDDHIERIEDDGQSVYSLLGELKSMPTAQPSISYNLRSRPVKKQLVKQATSLRRTKS